METIAGQDRPGGFKTEDLLQLEVLGQGAINISWLPRLPFEPGVELRQISFQKTVRFCVSRRAIMTPYQR